jgi:hypothetical protein
MINIKFFRGHPLDDAGDGSLVPATQPSAGGFRFGNQ